MILDFGSSMRRYHVSKAGFIWTNGAPGGGAIIVEVLQKFRGFAANVGRLMGT